MRDGNFQVSLIVELSDDQIRRIEEPRNQADGSFNLRLGLRLDGTDRDRKYLSNTGTLSNVRVSRGDWLSFFQQVKYRRVIVVELEVPEAARTLSSPRPSTSTNRLRAATPQAITADNRNIRQALATLVGEASEAELSPRRNDDGDPCRK